MSARLRLDIRPSAARLVAATLLGRIVGTVVLLAATLLFRVDDAAAYLGEDPLWAAAGHVYLAVFAGGVLPTLATGAVLMALQRANAVTLVLTPAILFAMVLALARHEIAGLMLPLAAAMPSGAAVMLLLLARARPKLDIESVFA